MKAKKEPKSLKDIPKKFVGLAMLDPYNGLELGTLSEMRDLIELGWVDYIIEAIKDGDSTKKIRKELIKTEVPSILALYEYRVADLSCSSLLLTDKFLKECELAAQEEKDKEAANYATRRRDKLSKYLALYKEFDGVDPTTLTRE